MSNAPQLKSNRPIGIVADPILRFAQLESAGAILLLLMTVLALVWANSPWGESYHHLWSTPVSFGFGEAVLSLPLEAWVNDGLMAIFFFTVGLEIKREMVLGELSKLSRAMLPVMGALGGMIVPAGIYASIHLGGAAASGWGVPMATDIAFAVAALAVLGKRVPPPLKVFLLALAIADDLGAVTVIAVFYTETIYMNALFISFGLLGLVFLMNVLGVRAFPAYWLVGAFVWFFMHESGVHATIAGVLLGMLTPATSRTEPGESFSERIDSVVDKFRGLVNMPDEEDYGGHKKAHVVDDVMVMYTTAQSPLDYLLHQLERFVAIVIMPVFALANAGVVFDSNVFGNEMSMMVALAVGTGLLVGKPIGITLFAWLSVRLGFAVLPTGVNWAALAGTGFLAGIGFTMALFVTNLAFTDPILVSGSKIGIFAGSLVSATIGLMILGRALPKAAASD
ncbi:MAG: Na+/H+ antiporter NhaA [Candidatus Binatia bacterium]|nr:Na+/H+ antiporter NhaA [Candidatus Binatia bacterium]